VTTLHVLIVLSLLTLIFQAYSAVMSVTLNTRLGFKYNKGWFFITLAFSFSTLRRALVCFEIAAQGYRPPLHTELFSTVLTLLLAVGLYKLSRPHAYHKHNAKLLSQRGVKKGSISYEGSRDLGRSL